MAHVESVTAERPSRATKKTRDQIIVEAAGDPAIAAPALAELAHDRVQPAYLNHPGLKAYAEARAHTEDTDLGREDYDDEVARRCDRADEIVSAQVYDAPARSPHDILAKLAAFICDFGGGKVAPDDPELFAKADGMMLNGIEVLAGIASELQGFLAPAPWPEPSEWDAAVVAYREAERRFVEATAKVNAADAAAEAASLPPPELMFVPVGKKDARHYLTEEEIVTDTRLPIEERLKKVALFHEWSAVRTAAYDEQGCDQAEADFEAASEALTQAKDLLSELTAPDAEGVRLKLQIHIEDYQLQNLAGIDLDEEGLSCLLTSERCTDQEIGRIYRDLALIANPKSPLARTTAFDPLEWIEEFEKLPGHVVHEHGIGFIEPHAFPDGVFGDAPPPGRALLDALTDWQRKAVRRAGRHREGVRRIVKDIVMTYANSWDTREKVAGCMKSRHPQATYEQMQEAWEQVDAMDDVVFGLSKEEAMAREGTRWLVAWRIGCGTAWIDRETNELVIGCSPDSLGSDMRFMRDEIARLPDLKAKVREALQDAAAQ